jgi:hypothetical protein
VGERYDVNGDETVPLPEGLFNGPRDECYGFSYGGCGRLRPGPTQVGG